MLGLQVNIVFQSWQPSAPFRFAPLAQVLQAQPKSAEGPDAGQLFIIGFEGKEVSPELESTIRQLKPGGIILTEQNIASPEQVKELISNLQEISLQQTGLPLLVTVDQEGLPISRVDFTIEKTAQSEITDTGQAYYVGLWRGRELKALGINLNLAPLLDIASLSDFIFHRTFQKDASEVGRLSGALIRGQRQAGVLTAIKHFPGYGNIVFNPEERLAVLSKLPQISQFEQVKEQGPEFVMCANAVYQEIDPNLPFCFSGPGIQFLKQRLGEDILIISDDLSQNSLLNQFSIEEIVALPLKAGVDMLIFSGWRAPPQQALFALKKAVENGRISEARIKEAVSKITEIKKKYF